MNRKVESVGTSLLKKSSNQFAGRTLGHAVVIGGSMAGLLTARVLTEHFAQVTIIERDRFPENPLTRRGVPQSDHLHVLLRRGLMILEELFPSLGEELIAAGARTIDTGADLAWLTPAGWGVRFRSGLTKLACSRPLIDWVVRRRLVANERIRFLEQSDALHLIAKEQRTGVMLRSGEDSRRYPVFADLVVDATGRGSRAPKWLAELGYESPRETVVNAFLGYASRLYQLPAGFESDWQAIFLQAAPPRMNRAGVLFPIEGDRWMLTVAGAGRDYPPDDQAGFMEFVRNLGSPLIYSAIKDAAPISPIRSYRATENRLRHYEELKRLPEGLVLIGDSVCAFNPVYGQGMTIAALGAVALDKCLHEQRSRFGDGSLRGLPSRFQKQLAKVNKVAWALATGEDYRYRETEGAAPSILTRFMHRYVDEVISLTTKDRRLRQIWLEVFHMLRPPSAMFSPAVVLKVIRQAIGDHSLKPAWANGEAKTSPAEVIVR
jgi:2-polyprenyl-6-methoxyphenol hydroxylase-like FAD-dependent oxidoreductase